MMNKPKSTIITTLVLTLILTTTTLSRATRPEPNPNGSKPNPRPISHHHRDQEGPGGGGQDNGPSGFLPPGGGFGIPGFDNNWGQGIFGSGPGGYGYGFGGPKGGYSRGGIIRPSLVCKDKGPCYMKKLTCPAKCFSSFSRSGKGFGGGGGGGGCTMDCKKKCIAYC